MADKFENGIPRYEVHHDWRGNITSVVYDGREIPQKDIVDLNSNDGFSVDYWKKKNPGEPYPWRIREDEKYITLNPRGSGDYSIHNARLRLEKELEELRNRVTPEHPYTLYDFYTRVIEYHDEWFDSEYDHAYNREHGWESFDDAEMCLVKAPWCTMPCYAIRLPKPVQLRKESTRKRTLEKLCDKFYEGIYLFSDIEKTCRQLEACGHKSDEFRNAATVLVELHKELYKDLEEEKAKGRR